MAVLVNDPTLTHFLGLYRRDITTKLGYPGPASRFETLFVTGCVDPPEHAALEFAAEAVHVDLIPQLSAHHAAFAPPSDHFEAGLLVSPDPCPVPHVQTPPSGSG